MNPNPDHKAIVSLIDDPDNTVRDAITNKILELGKEILPTLKSCQEDLPFDSPEGIERLNDLVEEIEFNEISERIIEWMKNPIDLLEGMWLANLTCGSEVSLADLNKEIERIKLEVWLDLRPDLTALEKINVLNHVFFKRFAFKGDNSDYHSPDNSFLHRVIKRKKGNPLSISILYSLVAQRLFIPVYGVNLPQHFVLAYLDMFDLPEPAADSKGLTGDVPQDEEILFYVNTFNEGAVFGKKHIETFLKQIKIGEKDDFYYPCSNRDIVLRVLRNLFNSYTLKGQVKKVKRFERLIHLVNERVYEKD